MMGMIEARGWLPPRDIGDNTQPKSEALLSINWLKSHTPTTAMDDANEKATAMTIDDSDN